MNGKTPYDPKIHGRHPIRLPGFDYSDAGHYFITICTQDKKRLFGRIRNGEMELNGLGEIARDELLKTPSLRPNVQIDAWILMPDHVHFILNIRSRANRQAGVGAWRAMPLPATDVRIVLRVVQTRIDRNQYVNVHEPAG